MFMNGIHDYVHIAVLPVEETDPFIHISYFQMNVKCTRISPTNPSQVLKLTVT